MAAIPCGKTRPVSRPYEVWEAGDWQWRVLKKYQKDDHKPYARWYCAVKSPYTYGTYDMGDTYAEEVMRNAVLVSTDY